MSKKKKRNKKTLNKPLLAIILIVIILLFDFLVFKLTETGTFTVYNYATNQEIKTYKHFIFAKNVMKKEEADTICIKNQDNEIVALKYGVVNLKKKDKAKDIEYKTEDGTKGTINGDFGVDALYLETSNSGKRVEIMISGIKIWVSMDDVEIFNIEENLNVSYYSKNQDSIFHTISLDIDDTNSSSIMIGLAPAFMQEGTNYYSYDGNYFYTDYKTMNKDMINGTYSHAINQEPYFNFYQYVPHRTYSNINMEAINNHLTASKGITDVASYIPCDVNQSVLYNLGDHFIAAQNAYGINASMMYVLAYEESGYGQSEKAIVNHNLYNHKVYNKTLDRDDSYTTFDDCIYQHAFYFLQQEYCNPENENYHGSWFGNKASGINVNYSSNPYWGEIKAGIYYQLDFCIGLADYSSIPLKTFVAKNDMEVFGSEKGKNKLYTIKEGDIVSLVIKNGETIEKDKYYIIASEVPVENKKKNIEATYTSECNGYIEKKKD